MMAVVDDTNDIHIPSSFISRASFLVIRDLMSTGHSALHVLVEPDDGYDWRVSTNQNFDCV